MLAPCRGDGALLLRAYYSCSSRCAAAGGGGGRPGWLCRGQACWRHHEAVAGDIPRPRVHALRGCVGQGRWGLRLSRRWLPWRRVTQQQQHFNAPGQRRPWWLGHCESAAQPRMRGLLLYRGYVLPPHIRLHVHGRRLPMRRLRLAQGCALPSRSTMTSHAPPIPNSRPVARMHAVHE